MHPWDALGDAMGVQVLWGQGCASPGSSVTPSHQVWRVETQELVPVEQRWVGHFYGGDCYLVLYTYYVGPKVNRIIYIWQVRACPLPRAHPQQGSAGQGHPSARWPLWVIPCPSTASPSSLHFPKRARPHTGPPCQHG